MACLTSHAPLTPIVVIHLIPRLSYQDPNGQIGGITAVTYRYDANGNLIDREDAAGDSNFQFDELNRLVCQLVPTPGEESRYDYDTAGNLTTIDPSNQADVAYTYDHLNRTATVTDQRGRTTTSGYNSRDMRTRTSYPNGVTMRQNFDDSGRLACSYAHTGSAPSTGSNGCPTPRRAY